VVWLVRRRFGNEGRADPSPPPGEVDSGGE